MESERQFKLSGGESTPLGDEREDLTDNERSNPRFQGSGVLYRALDAAVGALQRRAIRRKSARYGNYLQLRIRDGSLTPERARRALRLLDSFGLDSETARCAYQAARSRYLHGLVLAGRPPSAPRICSYEPADKHA